MGVNGFLSSDSLYLKPGPLVYRGPLYLKPGPLVYRGPLYLKPGPLVYHGPLPAIQNFGGFWAIV